VDLFGPLPWALFFLLSLFVEDSMSRTDSSGLREGLGKRSVEELGNGTQAAKHYPGATTIWGGANGGKYYMHAAK